jgi:hypothetical protein
VAQPAGEPGARGPGPGPPPAAAAGVEHFQFTGESIDVPWPLPAADLNVLQLLSDLHRGRVLLEGYDYALRAYTFRKRGEDRVRLTMTPTAPQVNPVFLITGWRSPGVRVSVNDEPLAAERFRAQVCGHDLTVWVQGKFEQPTGIDFRPELQYTICA